ncbi:cytosol nonspecific dipeptidase, partial [Enterobacter roggenkampii]
MAGGFRLHANWGQAVILIKNEYQAECVIYNGCAGGIDFIFSMRLSGVAFAGGFQTFKL